MTWTGCPAERAGQRGKGRPALFKASAIGAYVYVPLILGVSNGQGSTTVESPPASGGSEL